LPAVVDSTQAVADRKQAVGYRTLVVGYRKQAELLSIVEHSLGLHSMQPVIRSFRKKHCPMLFRNRT